MGNALDLFAVLLDFDKLPLFTLGVFEESDVLSECDDDQLVFVAVDHVDSWTVEVMRPLKRWLHHLPDPQETAFADLEELGFIDGEEHCLDLLFVLEGGENGRPCLGMG
jgi:hypothetical protein